MDLIAAFNQAFPDRQCDETDNRVMCMVPAFEYKSKNGEMLHANPRQLTLTQFPTDIAVENNFMAAFKAARANDSSLGPINSGRCYARQWEHEDYGYHTGEKQSTSEHDSEGTAPDGKVFCYTNANGERVIVWSQTSMSGEAPRYLGETSAQATVDAFRTFYWVHHSIGM